MFKFLFNLIILLSRIFPKDIIQRDNIIGTYFFSAFFMKTVKWFQFFAIADIAADLLLFMSMCEYFFRINSWNEIAGSKICMFRFLIVTSQNIL